MVSSNDTERPLVVVLDSGFNGNSTAESAHLALVTRTVKREKAARQCQGTMLPVKLTMCGESSIQPSHPAYAHSVASLLFSMLRLQLSNQVLPGRSGVVISLELEVVEHESVSQLKPIKQRVPIHNV